MIRKFLASVLLVGILGASSLVSVSAAPPGYFGTDPAFYVAEVADVVANGCATLPNASGPGLEILPGTLRYQISQADCDGMAAQAAIVVDAYSVTDKQLSAAKAALACELAAMNYAACGAAMYADPGHRAMASAHYEDGWYDGPVAGAMRADAMAALEASLK